MRHFTDLHLIPPVQDLEQCARMAAFARELGYAAVGVTLPPSLPNDQVKKVKQAFAAMGLHAATRVDLHVASRREFLAALRRVRSAFDLIAVPCEEQSIVRMAIRDRRVDIIYFSLRSKRGMNYLSMFRKSKAVLEINLSDILELGVTASILGVLKEVVQRVTSIDARVVISSGARGTLGMRAPLDVVSLLSEVLANDREALSAVANNPMAVIGQRPTSPNSKTVEEGVRVLKG